MSRVRLVEWLALGLFWGARRDFVVLGATEQLWNAFQIIAPLLDPREFLEVFEGGS